MSICKLLINLIVVVSIPFSSFSQQALRSEKHDFAKSAPFFISRDPVKLSQYLTAESISDAEKAQNIYTWIVHNIKYDIKASQKIRTRLYSVSQTLRRKRGICFQYSALFAALCQNAGVSALEIQGYSKGLGSLEGEEFYTSDHSWNGVKIDSAWYLVDATWGSGKATPKKQRIDKLLFKLFNVPYVRDKYKFRKEPNYYFFLTEPAALLKDHLPVDPNWQLVQHPVSVTKFQEIGWNGPDISIDSRRYGNEKKDYMPVLDRYHRLSPNQYLKITAAEAHLFNPKNFALLSESYFRDGHS